MKIQKNNHVYNSNTPKVTVFPEEYFSGCDVVIKIENEILTDISNITFAIQEQMKPVYGYSSRVYDAVAIGNRIVMGSFVIPVSSKDKLRQALVKANESVKLRAPSPTLNKLVNEDALDEAFKKYKYQHATEYVTPAFDYKPYATEGSNKTGFSVLEAGLYDDYGETYPEVQSMVKLALKQVGKPYVLGADGPSAFDCSGLVLFVLRESGFELPGAHSENPTYKDMRASEIYSNKNAVLKLSSIWGKFKIGDLGFKKSKNPKVGYEMEHVGMYLGDGVWIHASSGQGKVVLAYEDKNFHYWDAFARPRTIGEAMEEKYGKGIWIGGKTYLEDGKFLKDGEVVTNSSNMPNKYELIRTPTEWRTRFISHKEKRDSLGRNIIESSEFPYETMEPINLRIPTLKYKDISYMATDTISKIVITQSHRQGLSIEELHNESINGNSKGFGCHFYIRKDCTVEQGMPLCTSIRKDNSVYIMVEGYYDAKGTIKNAYYPVDNKPPSPDVFNILTILINDIKKQSPNLTSLFGERERYVIYDNGGYEDITSPGYLFPIDKLASYTGLRRPDNVANKFSNMILDKLAVNNMNEVLSYGKEENNENNSVRLLMEDINEHDGSLKNYKSHELAHLGNLSMKYESSKITPRPEFYCKDGEYKGKTMYSYGSYQMHARHAMQGFMALLRNKNVDWFKQLNSYAINSSGFNQKWKELGLKYPQKMHLLQWEYIKVNYYDISKISINKEAKKLGIEFKIDDFSLALKNSIWSISVHRGANTAANIVKEAMNENRQVFDNGEEESIIKLIYKYRKQELIKNVKNIKQRNALIKTRCEQEMIDCLDIIGKAPERVKYLVQDEDYLKKNENINPLKLSPYEGIELSIALKDRFSKNVYELQRFLNVIGNEKLTVDGYCGRTTLSAIEKFNKNAKLSTGASYLSSQGTVGQTEWNNFMSLAKTLEFAGKIVNGVMVYHKDGVAGLASEIITRSIDPITLTNKTNLDAKLKYNQTNGVQKAELISSIWGLKEIEPTLDRMEPHFYDNVLKELQIYGLNLEIKYGHIEGPVKKIKNLFIRGVQQQIDASGQHVADVYDFIARDIE